MTKRVNEPGNRLLLLLSGWLLILQLVSCTTQESRPKHEESSHPVVSAEHKKDVSDSSESLNAEIPVSPPVSEVSADPLADVARLWNNGYFAQARLRFYEADCRELEYGDRRDEWRMWRGRLFTLSWDSLSLGTAGNNYSSLLVDEEDVWAGTWTGGLTRLSWPLDTVVVHDPGQPSLAVRTVNRIIKRENEILVLRYGALERYNKRSGKWRSEQNLPVSERLQDIVYHGGRLYLATLGYGLWRESGMGWEQLSAPGLFITRLEVSDDGRVLVGTMDRGLFVLQPGDQEDSWSRPPQGPLTKENITSISLSQDGVYLGSYGSGAYFWNTKEDSIRSFGKDELGDLWVLAVAADSNRVFFGTFGAGIAVLNQLDETWEKIVPGDGLLTGDVSSLTLSIDGAIWAGTLGGGVVRIAKDFYEN